MSRDSHIDETHTYLFIYLCIYVLFFHLFIISAAICCFVNVKNIFRVIVTT